MKDDRLAAVWARVSTPEQAELSLESQVTRVESKLRSLGFKVPPEYVFRTDWTSLNLTPCPEFQSLLQLARQGRIDAVGTLDRDRFQAIGLDRMIFMAECRHKGIEIIVCQGPPFLEGPEGDIVEVALAVAKKIQVRRPSRHRIHHRASLSSRFSAGAAIRCSGGAWTWGCMDTVLPVGPSSTCGYIRNNGGGIGEHVVVGGCGYPASPLLKSEKGFTDDRDRR